MTELQQPKKDRLRGALTVLVCVIIVLLAALVLLGVCAAIVQHAQ